VHGCSLKPHLTSVLQDVMDGKNATIRDLQYELARMSKAYNDAGEKCERPPSRQASSLIALVSALQAKLEEHGIPVQELGFSLVPMNAAQPLGKAPAGLVA